MATYLVTGAAGFIGTNFVHYLLSDVDGAEPVALDNLGFAGNPANLDPVRDRIRFVEADIADAGAMRAVHREFEPEYVVNFAAESHNDRAIVDWYAGNEGWWQDILRRKGDLQIAWAGAG